MKGIISLFSGVMFGAGMVLSGMASPEKVIGFLDVTGEWDPTLLFVFVGALGSFIPLHYLLIARKAKRPRSSLPSRGTVDKRLLIGAALFGVGWGIAGVCPGPAVTSLATLDSGPIIFIISLLAGLWLGERFIIKRQRIYRVALE